MPWSSLSDFDPEELKRWAKKWQDEIFNRFLYGSPDDPPPKPVYGKPIFDDYIVPFFTHDARPAPYTEEQARLARHEVRDAEIDGGE